MTEAGAAERIRRLRGFLLLLVYVTVLGLTAELVFLEHWGEQRVRLVPFVALALGFVASLGVTFRPGANSLWIFRLAMLLCLAAGVAGLYFHFSGNRAFELEMYPTRSGFELIWESLTGATPALAPGALAQLGLLGLAYTYRHPVLSRPVPAAVETTEALEDV